MSDYLFDKEGAPDPEIERLEGLLAPMAYRGAPPALPRPRRRAPMFVVAAAGIALAAALVAVLIARPWRPGPSGTVAKWIDTGESPVRLDVGIGTVELLAHTRARIVAKTKAPFELQLEHGTPIEATTGPAWTRKTPLRVRGTVLGRELDAPGLLDESAGRHPRRTSWLWSPERA